MNKLGRWLLGILVLVGITYYSIIKFIVPGYLAQAPSIAATLARDYINGSISVESISWNGGLEIIAQDIKVTDARKKLLAEMPTLKVSLSPWQALLNKERILGKIEIERPFVYLAMDQEDRWNIVDFLKPSESETTPFYGVLFIKEGTVITETPYGKWQAVLNGSVDGGGNPYFAIDAQLALGEDEVLLKGLIDMQAVGNLDIKTKHFALAPFAALAEHFGQVQKLQGALSDVDLRWQNDSQNINLSGFGKLSKVQGLLQVGSEEFALDIDGTVKFNDKVIKAQDFKLTINNQPAFLEGSLNFKDQENLVGQGQLTAEQLSYGGQTLTEIYLPFRFVENKLQIDEATATYGGGKIALLGEYAFKDGSVVADLELEKVHAIYNSGSINEEIFLNGSVGMQGVINAQQVQANIAANTLQAHWRDLTLHNVDFDIDLVDQAYKINNLSAFTPEGAVVVQGSLQKDGELAVEGQVARLPVASFLQAMGQEGHGNFTSKFTARGTLDNIEVEALVQLDQAEIAGVPITEALGKLKLQGQTLFLENYEVKQPQGTNILSGSIDLGAVEPVVDLAIETKGVRAEPFAQLVTTDFKLTGNVDNKIMLKGALSNLTAVGQVCLTDGSAQGYLIDQVGGEYIYQDGAVTLNNWSIVALSTTSVFSGTMDADHRLNFEIDAQNIALDNLPIQEETVDVDGFINAKGQLTGTLERPVFHGNVNSKSIFINGEELTDLDGKFDSDGGIKNKLLCSFKQPPQGVFSAEISFDTEQKLAQGNIVTIYGDLSSMLKMAKYPLNMDGLVQGSIEINPQGRGSGVFADVWVAEVKIGTLAYEKMGFKGRFHDKVVYFDDVKLLEKEQVTDRGVIALGGKINLKTEEVNAEIAAVDADPGIVTALMKDPVQLSGDLNMVVQLSGTLSEPQGNGSLSVTQGSCAGIAFDEITAMLSLKNDNLRIEQGSLSKDVYKTTLYGDLPLDLLRASSERRNPGAQMNIQLNLDNARLGILQILTPMVEWGIGDTKGQVVLSGTLEEPLLNGSIKIEDGSLKFKKAATIFDKINTDIEFKGNRVDLNDFSVQLGKGQFKATGTYALRSDAAAAYKLDLHATNAEIISDIFTGRINGAFEITPQRYRQRETEGNATNKEPTYNYRPLIKGEVRLDDVLINMPTIPEFGDGQSNIGLDVKLDLGPKIHLYNKYLYDLWLAGGLQISGSTVYTNINGSIKATRGTVSYLRTPFKISNAAVSWPIPGSILPTVNVAATAKFERYNIGMLISGPLEEMDLQLNSSPPLTKDQIIRMLTLQRDVTGSGNEFDSDDLQSLMNAGLEIVIFGDVEQIFKETLGLDQFRVYTGRLRSGMEIDTRSNMRELTSDERNQYNVLFSKYITPNFMLGYTTSMDNQYYSFFGQYEVSRHFNVNYSVNEKQEKWYGVEYKITF